MRKIKALKHKVHMRATLGLGICGYSANETTKDKSKVTCGHCKRIIKSKRYYK
jgi:hypothetical protein